MRCSCKECGTYMIQAESDHLGCVCPDCGYRCNDCLGTNTVVGRESLKALAFDPRFDPGHDFPGSLLKSGRGRRRIIRFLAFSFGNSIPEGRNAS